MGFLWDLIQQNQISHQKGSLESIEERISALENRLSETQQLQRRLIATLKEHLGSDMDWEIDATG